MTLITAKQRRRALDFADEIAKLAAQAPDAVTKRDLYRTAQGVRRRFGFSEDQKRSMVRQAISLGANTYRDLTLETGFPVEVVKSIVESLRQQGEARVEKMSLSGHGRPQMLIIAPQEV